VDHGTHVQLGAEIALRIALVAPFGLRAKGTTRARALPLARELAHRGHAVALFIPPYDSPEDAGKRWNDAGVEVVNAPLVNAPLPRSGPSRYFALAWHLLRVVAAWQPEGMHIFKPKGPSGLVATVLWATRGGRLQQVPPASALVIDSDDWEGSGGWNDDPRVGYSPLQKRFFAWQERTGLSHADAWTVTSECLRQRAVSFGAMPDKVFILHNGVSDFGFENPESVIVNRQSSIPLRFAPGTIVRNPQSAILYTRFAGVRPTDVLAIWARVRERLPDARLTVVGRGVGGEARELSGAPGIEVVGWVEPEKLPALFAGMQVALVPWADTPSNRARHSAKVLELMSASLPVVACAVGELPATLGETGSLVPPGDAAVFAQAVAELLTDRERARRLGAAAQLRVHERFAWPRLADVALAAYAAALGTGKE
jgi:glycosyltransferase involved in cell wall biosynthesis